jgi:hypothetical protein
MPNRVHMVGAGRFEKLLKVISGLPSLVLEVTFSGGNELLIGVVGLLVFAALVTAGGDCDSLGSLLWPPLVTFGAPLCALVGFLEGSPLTTIGGRLPVALDENGSDCLLTGGMPGADVEQLLHGLQLITAELVHQGSAVHVGPECRDDVSVIDLGSS